MEFGESFEGTARRETKEETGMEIDDIRFLHLSNIKRYAGKHYVHIGLIASWKSGNPEILEPDKTEGWEWYNLKRLPSPVFLACEQSFQAYKNGVNYLDS